MVIDSLKMSPTVIFPKFWLMHCQLTNKEACAMYYTVLKLKRQRSTLSTNASQVFSNALSILS